MKFIRLLFILSITLLLSCTHNHKNNISDILNENSLLSQNFSVDNDRDTTLLTKNGCVIKIQKGTFENNSSNTKLEIKEALSMTDIALAGLTTMSGKQSLSSGGMIYINAANGQNVTIKKQIEISVPTKTYDPDMQVFKGAKKKDGKIDWTEPTALPKDETNTRINNGEALYKANCANCHKINDDYTGPALYGITERRTKKWLYDFTRCPACEKPGDAYDYPRDSIKQIKEYSPDQENDTDNSDFDFYRACLFAKWKPTIMTSFPALTDTDLDALYSYIKTESDKRPDLKEKYKKNCCDSCELYKKEILAFNKAKNKREELINDNGNFFTLDKTISVPEFPEDTTTFPIINDDKHYVSPTSVKATYYTIKVEAFGWYNIDCMIKNYDDCKESELFVTIEGEHKKEDYNICLIIPGRKLFVEGGKLDNGDQYGFFETNGKIILPQNEKCYIIAYAQYEDKIVYGKASFISGLKQTISINPGEASKESMLKEFKDMDLDGANMQINKSKNADKIRDTDKKIDSLKKYMPKNCDCIFDYEVPENVLAKK